MTELDYTQTWMVYVEMPDVSRSDHYATRGEAMDRYESIVTHYADAYVAVYDPYSLDPVQEYGR